MAERNLATYLTDHLAGSAVALELLDHLERLQQDSLVMALRLDILADRQQLEALMGRLQVSASPPRKAVGWVAGKMSELKLWLDDPSDSGLRRLEILEALSVGVEGKRLLWRSLAAAAASHAGLRGLDYGELERRAEDQRARIEAERLRLAVAALAVDPPAD